MCWTSTEGRSEKRVVEEEEEKGPRATSGAIMEVQLSGKYNCTRDGVKKLEPAEENYVMLEQVKVTPCNHCNTARQRQHQLTTSKMAASGFYNNCNLKAPLSTILILWSLHRPLCRRLHLAHKPL